MPSFSMEMHLKMSVWLAVTRLGRTLLWNLKPGLIICFATKPQSSHELFNWRLWQEVHHGFTWVFRQKILTQWCLVAGVFSVFPNLLGSTLILILWMWQKATFPPQLSVIRMYSPWQVSSREQQVQTGLQWQSRPSLGMYVW